MTALRLTDLLYGESRAHVDRQTASLAWEKSDLNLGFLNLSMQDLDADTPLFLVPTTAPGAHLSGFQGQVYDAWMRGTVPLDDDDFGQAVLNATALHHDLFSVPWGLLCGLVQGSEVWFMPGRCPDELIDQERVILRQNDCTSQAELLHRLDGKLTGWEGQPWLDVTPLAFLVARNARAYGSR